jgi:hypothetical protein
MALHQNNKGPVTGLCCSQGIERAEHAAPALVEHMRINHGGSVCTLRRRIEILLPHFQQRA